MLLNQLATSIIDMRSNDEFLFVKRIVGLVEKLVKRKKK